MSRLVDQYGKLFKQAESTFDTTWGTGHLKRSELFSFQLQQIFHEDLIASRWVSMIGGGSMIDLTTTFTQQLHRGSSYGN